MSRQRRAIDPHDPERFIANVFHAVLLAERGIKGRLRADFPFPFALDHDLGAPADEEQHLFGFIVHVVGDHAADFGDVHPHRDILDPAKLGGQQ